MTMCAERMAPKTYVLPMNFAQLGGSHAASAKVVRDRTDNNH